MGKDVGRQECAKGICAHANWPLSKQLCHRKMKVWSIFKVLQEVRYLDLTVRYVQVF